MKQYVVEDKKKEKKKSQISSDFRKQSVHLKTAKTRDLSSANWLRRHMNDSFVQMAAAEGFLSRAAYKIIEIIEKYPEIKKSKTILDLGCSPGSWSQAINEMLNYNCKIVGIDLIEPKYSAQNLRFIQGDFEHLDIQDEMKKDIDKFDLIVSDIAHNAIGNRNTDKIINVRNLESCIPIIEKYLKKDSYFITKTLYGSDQMVVSQLKDKFHEIKRFKPKASRKESTELYIICIKKKEQ